jgi:hypothetical protein
VITRTHRRAEQRAGDAADGGAGGGGVSRCSADTGADCCADRTVGDFAVLRRLDVSLNAVSRVLLARVII